MWLFAPEGNNQNGITDRSRQVTTDVSVPSHPFPVPLDSPMVRQLSDIPCQGCLVHPAKCHACEGRLCRGVPFACSASHKAHVLVVPFFHETAHPHRARVCLRSPLRGDPPWHRFHISRLMFGKGSHSCVTIVTCHQLISHIYLLVSLSSSVRS